MAALKGSGRCWAHDPGVAAARTAARAAGNTNRRSQPEAPFVAPPPAPFALGPIERRGDVAVALLRVAHAIADGSLDPKRGRLLTEALRSSHAAWDSTTLVSDEEIPAGAREPTQDELEFMTAHGGRFPPGVQLYGKWRPFWVTGEPWSPDIGERKSRLT